MRSTSTNLIAHQIGLNNNRFVYTSLSDAIQKFEEYDGHKKRLRLIARNNYANASASDSATVLQQQPSPVKQLNYGFS